MSDITNYENLANAIIPQVVRDYRMARSASRQIKNKTALADKDEVERFFRSDWFSVLSSVDGGC